MWEVYKDCYKETMAIPFVAGRKAEHEKFAGAEDTYTIEALMHDGIMKYKVLEIQRNV